MFFGLCAPAPAQENTAEPKEEVANKLISGQVSGISGNFIAVDCGMNPEGTGSREMVFNVDEGVQIEHKKSIKEIGVGDTVDVAYDEITKTAQDGKKTSKRVARAISFIRAAEKRPADEEAGVFKSEE